MDNDTITTQLADALRLALPVACSRLEDLRETAEDDDDSEAAAEALELSRCVESWRKALRDFDTLYIAPIMRPRPVTRTTQERTYVPSEHG